MDFTDFTAGPDDENRRLDKVIRIFAADLTLSQIYKSLRKGLIKVNQKKSTPDYHVQNGDKISFATFLLKNNSEIKNNKENTNSSNNSKYKIEDLILFQNQNIIIINKPVNINVHSSSKEDVSLQNLVNEYALKIKNKDSLSFQCGPLHRLDRMTSGTLAFGLSTACSTWFTQIMKDHLIKKTYVGIIQGKLMKEETWIDYLEKENDDSKGFHTVKVYDTKNENTDAKECITKITPIAAGKYKNKDITFVKYNIETGRQHQIRAQSSYHNHPLLGDTAYKGEKITDIQVEFFLHAIQLELPQNDFEIPQKLQAPLPQEFHKFLSQTCDIHSYKL